ncbi:MAG: Lon protease [Lentisphaerae bacterium ADurb.BinA184]|nr:MAG: Lon protease [Lentisphaerae bacterium ADurb.BinA184]
MANENDSSILHPEIVEAPREAADDHRGTPAAETLVLAAKELPDRIHLLPTPSKPVFPGLVFPIMVPQGPVGDLLKAVAAEVPERVVGFVLTRQEEPGDLEKLEQADLYLVGTAARILRLQETPDGSVQALLRGERRFHLLKAVRRDGRLVGQVAYVEDVAGAGDAVRAMAQAIVASLRELIKHNPLFSEEIKSFLVRTDWGEPGRLADFATQMTSATREEAQDVLECLDVRRRLEKVLFLLRKELDLNQLKEKITHQIEEKITAQQREFFLREQLKAIKQELGLEKDEKTEEIERYEARLAELTLGEEARTRIREEIDRLKVLSPQSPEYSVSRTYLDWLTGLPWGKYSEDVLDVARGRGILDRDHYGLEDVKKRILEFIGVAKLRGRVEGSILCLIGPPGVGKTSLGRAVAEALGRQFYRFSLGGMRDEAEIKGHRRTYIGALPGKVIQAIKTVGTANPVIMLDEIDKVGASYQGDPASALLEVLDPEQNCSFRDHYLDVPFDLSKVLFIATANLPDTIPGPLLDRMEVIRLSGYIVEEKLAIAERHLVPRVLERAALNPELLHFTTPALRAIIEGYAREAGVRNLEKALSSVARKVAAGRAEGIVSDPVVVTPANVAEYLGKPVFLDDPLMKRRRAGVVMGLAWTPFGGSTLYVEAIRVPRREHPIKLTGQLGEVMAESTHIAYSMVTAGAESFGIAKDFFQDATVHLHVPAGATPKDGPSAGITMATALISLASNRKVPAGMAMTGELTLTGRVLPVGGIKEKIIAARRSKVRTVILPKANERDFAEIPEAVRRGLTVHFVEDFREVCELVFPSPAPAAR